jgi:hypothetical protein
MKNSKVRENQYYLTVGIHRILIYTLAIGQK